MKIGVAVQGPSDREFWVKVLHKNFPLVQFDVRNMKCQFKLIKSIPRFFNNCMSLKYGKAFVLLDLDDSPCVSGLINSLDPFCKKEAKKPIEKRFLHICIAIRELEAWFLADGTAIQSIFERSNYSPKGDTGKINTTKQLEKILRENYGHNNSSLNKIEFARMIAPVFNPENAVTRSESFSYFWTRMKDALSP